MPSKTTTKVTYESLLCDGLQEIDQETGELFGGGHDEPYRIRIDKVTETIVTTGRGRDYANSTRTVETLADLSIAEVGGLVQSLVSDVAFAAKEAERRVLIPQKLAAE